MNSYPHKGNVVKPLKNTLVNKRQHWEWLFNRSNFLAYSQEELHSTTTKTSPLRYDCWWSIHYGMCPVLRLFLRSSSSRQRFPSALASSAAGYGCGRKTWSPSSLAGCLPAWGRVRGSARSLPSQGPAAPWGFSWGESPLLRARPLTRDASARRAFLSRTAK